MTERNTALASGSGDHSGGVTDMIDHAELLRSVLQDSQELSRRGLSPDVRLNEAERVAVTALLAENAALRVRLGGALDGDCKCCVLTRAKCADTVSEIEIGRTEAELAEAVAVIRDVDRAARQAASMNDAGYTVTVERTATHIYGITDTFLSKEAERG